MPRLEMRTGKSAGKSIELTKAVIVGRGENVGIRIADVKASREHCRVFQQGGKWVVADLNSRNGITVNGAKTTRKELVSGDEVAIGETVLAYVDEAAAGKPAARPMPGEIQVDEIDLEVGDDAPAPSRAAAAKQPAGAAKRPAAKGAKGSSAKDAAFAAARASAARAGQKKSGRGAAGGGGAAETGIQVSDKVLQYNRVDSSKASSLGMDLSQYPVLVQLAIVVGGLAAVGALIWLIFKALGVTSG